MWKPGIVRLYPLVYSGFFTASPLDHFWTSRVRFLSLTEELYWTYYKPELLSCVYTSMILRIRMYNNDIGTFASNMLGRQVGLWAGWRRLPIQSRTAVVPGGFLATQRLVMVPYLMSLGSSSATETRGCRFPMSAKQPVRNDGKCDGIRTRKRKSSWKR